MAIDMPTNVGFLQSDFFLSPLVDEFESPMSGQMQKVIRNGSKWNVTYTLPRMSLTQKLEWGVFFNRLRGGAVTFNAYDPDRLAPQGTPVGTPLVNGGSQTGFSLETDGWEADTDNLLLPGDLIKVNNELKEVSLAVNSNSSGEATITFEPALGNSPSDNAVISYNNLTIEVYLTGTLNSSLPTDKNRITDVRSFNGVEVIF